MDKTRTSRKRRTSSLNMSNRQPQLRDDVEVKKFEPEKYLSKEFIGAAIMECLSNNDPEGVVELVKIYLEEHNKTTFCKEANLARSTAYNALKNKNPTLKTLAKIIHASTH